MSRLPRHKVLFYRAKVLRRENAKYRFANNSVELTTTFHECAISGISLTSLFGTFTGYGVAELRHYYDDGLLLTEDYCIFALDTWGNDPLVIFYPCNDELEVVCREDKRNIELLDGNSFNMRSYGTGESTSLHYTRQN